jgi:hypothetical protein
VKFICLPGVSSKDTVTELSGRGMGMGAVADACEALGRTVEVKSQREVGTRIDFSFPKSQAVYEGHAAILRSALVPVGTSPWKAQARLTARGKQGTRKWRKLFS